MKISKKLAGAAAVITAVTACASFVPVFAVENTEYPISTVTKSAASPAGNEGSASFTHSIEAMIVTEANEAVDSNNAETVALPVKSVEAEK